MTKVTYNRMKEAYLKNEMYVSKPLSIKKENRRIMKDIELELQKEFDKLME